MGTTPMPSPLLEQGRLACERRDWRTAHERLTRADAEGTLRAEDLWLLGLSAYLLGLGAGYIAALERAHRLQLDEGDIGGAARSAFWLGLHLADRGDVARASGWFSRAARILDRDDQERVERGYLLLAEAHGRFATGDAPGAHDRAEEAAQLAGRFGDRDLLALTVHLQGRSLISQGRVQDGLTLLDEAMVAVEADELSPQVTGLIYCSVLGACRSVHALSRAREWTAALHDWCERQPDMIAYSGECRVYRAELMQLHGAWREALDEARRAGEILGTDGGTAAALALYQQGETHRLLGEFAAAEEAFRAAGRAGREPQPGLALLRLAQGDLPAAAAAIRRVLGETTDPLRRSRLLPAHVEIMLAGNELDEAGRSCEELQRIASTYRVPVLDATASLARGALLLAGQDARGALPHLRSALQEWHAIGAPYEAARARALLGLACRELGDHDTAGMEIDSACAELARLGAAADLARLRTLSGGNAPRQGHGLTARELEVLTLVATGRSNRAIARALFISDRTVARHLSNIFQKLGLASRAAATAYAYEHDLVRPST